MIELKDLLIEKIISLKIFRNEEKLKKKKRVNNLDDDMELLNMETLQIEIKFGEWRIWIRICAFNIGDGLKIFLEIGGCFHWPREMNNSSSM